MLAGGIEQPLLPVRVVVQLLDQPLQERLGGQLPIPRHEVANQRLEPRRQGQLLVSDGLGNAREALAQVWREARGVKRVVGCEKLANQFAPSVRFQGTQHEVRQVQHRLPPVRGMGLGPGNQFGGEVIELRRGCRQGIPRTTKFVFGKDSPRACPQAKT
ncbi:hypothetical protein CCR91_07290 [Thiorhodovibrio winogradskyi]|nr:hypothetical protein [Thiorhodovibrio winogradskyi]